MVSHWSADPGSIVVLGRTQTGKTTFAREVHATNNRLSVWLNEKGKDRVPNVAGKRVASLRGLESGMTEGTLKFNWLASDRDRDIQVLTEWAWRKAQSFDRRLPIQIVGDELHRLAPQSNKNVLPGRDSVRQILKEGQKRNIKMIGITQDPIALDKQSIRQREYLAVFALSIEQKRYMADYGVSVDSLNELPEYTGTILHADGSVLAEGVKAAAKYA